MSSVPESKTPEVPKVPKKGSTKGKKKGGSLASRPDRDSFRSNVVKTIHDGLALTEDQWPTDNEVVLLLEMLQATMQKRGFTEIRIPVSGPIVVAQTDEALARKARAKSRKDREKAVLRAVNAHLGESFANLKKVRKAGYKISGEAFEASNPVTAEAVAQWVRRA